jgi:hypothetical protein
MASRDKSIYFARLAEQGERYEDMIRYMKEVVKVRMGAGVVGCHLGLDIFGGQFQ